MKSMKVWDRVLLLGTCLLAAYQVVIGVEGLNTLSMISYTIAFGVLLVAALLMIILGFGALDTPVVAIVATVIPFGLSLGLVWEYLPQWRFPYLLFVVVGFLAIVITRLTKLGRLASWVLALVHGVAGLVIFLLPIALSLTGQVGAGFALVGVGGALIGLGGLLLTFLRVGRPMLPQAVILKILPGLLLLTTAAFVLGFALG